MERGLLEAGTSRGGLDGGKVIEMGVNPDGTARLTIRSPGGEKLFQAP